MVISKRHAIFTLAMFFYLALPAWVSAAPIDFSEVKKLALFSNASYYSAGTMSDIARFYHYNVQKHGNIDDAQIQYFLLRHSQSGKQLIVVRGTANVENVVVDASIKLVKDELAHAYLHEGFAYGAKAVLNALAPDLNRQTGIDITGHSLGGAVAVVLGMYLDSGGYRVDNLYTFGQPKVTNIPGSVKFAHLHILRFVTPDDLIPLVPPLDPMDLHNIDIYWHVGEEVILLPGQSYSRIGVLNSMLRATKIFSTELGEKNLVQHKMQTYLDAIESKQQQVEEVPFKGDITVQDLLKAF